MNKQMEIKEVIGKALTEFLSSERGENMFGAGAVVREFPKNPATLRIKAADGDELDICITIW